MSGLTIVDARDLHVIRTISTGVDLPLFQIDWTTTGIVEVAGPCGPCGRATVVRINPVTGATTRAPLHGSFQQSTPTVDALYVVVGPVSGIGPSKIARLDGQRSRVFPLSRIRSGLDPRSTHPRHQWTPALAVDPTTDTCYVLAAGSPVAQADFGTGRVTYHALSERHSLADLLASWLIPPAAGKEDIYGASWTAQWLGDGYLALAGRTTTPDSTTPTGLRIVDVRHWSQTTLDRSADRFLVADGALIAIRDPVDGSGVDVGAPAFGYDDHGRRIFTVGDLAHRVYRIDVVGDLAFVFFYCTISCSYSVVDTETGDILGPKRGSTRLIEPLVGRTSQGY
jgi:hypothetical protein